MALPLLPLLAIGVVGYVALRRTEDDTPGAPADTSIVEDETHASWYGPGFDGRQTANGEIFDQTAMTAASRTLPFNTWLYVTDLDTGNGVAVRVNDRGPYAKNANGTFSRSLDLSAGAALALGITQKGVARVRIERFLTPNAPALSSYGRGIGFV